MRLPDRDAAPASIELRCTLPQSLDRAYFRTIYLMRILRKNSAGFKAQRELTSGARQFLGAQQIDLRGMGRVNNGGRR
jgi:hypothetical protein